jgi:hypothetical protein
MGEIEMLSAGSTLNRPAGTALSLLIVLAILARLLSLSPSGTKCTQGSGALRLG